MSLGAEGLILQALFSKLRQLSRVSALEILPVSRSDLLNCLAGSGAAMGPAGLTSLRGFSAAGQSGTPLPSPAASAAAAAAGPPRSTTFNLAAPVFTPATSRQFIGSGLSSHSSSSPQLHYRNHRQHYYHTTPSPCAPSRTVAHAGQPGSRRPLTTTAEGVATAQVAAAKVQEGRLIEYKVGTAGNYSLGLVLRQSPKSATAWEVEEESGALRTVKDKDIAFVLPGGSFTAAQLSIISKEASEKEDASLKEAVMALAWEISQPEALYTVEDMAELLFTSATPAACSAAHRLLLNDRLYFKQAGRQPPMYSARKEQDVQSMVRLAEAEKAAAVLQERFVADVSAARALPQKDRPTQQEWRAGPHALIFENLELFAFGQNLSTSSPVSRTELMSILGASGVQRSLQGAVDLLKLTGYWNQHVQMNLLSSGLTEEFPSDLTAAAAEVIAHPPPDPDAAVRQDLTALHIVTIDDESTTEIDDGLSAEILQDGSEGIQVWIHVADPTRWIFPGDSLDAEARRRSKTLYLPTGMIPMFPLSLATGPFSLRQGHQCCALTVKCIVESDGSIRAGSVNVTPSTVIPTLRMTYDIVDEMLEECSEEDEPALHALAAAAAARRRYRTAAGAVEIQMPEPKMDVKDINSEVARVEMEVINAPEDESVSRQLVAEMMILAGEVSARLGAHMNVPLPYRGQTDPILPPQEELEAVPAGPCRMVVLRSAMTRSITTADAPQRHAGLGLDAYAQVTSPIRRYGDLLAHWQLKAALRGDSPPFSVAALSETLSFVGATTQHVSKLERDAQAYWVAYYFKESTRKDAQAVWRAMFLNWFKQEAGLGRVLLEDLGLECLVKVARPAVPGTRLKVRCSSADPGMGLFRLDEVLESGAEGGVVAAEV